MSTVKNTTVNPAGTQRYVSTSKYWINVDSMCANVIIFNQHWSNTHSTLCAHWETVYMSWPWDIFLDLYLVQSILTANVCWQLNYLCKFLWYIYIHIYISIEFLFAKCLVDRSIYTCKFMLIYILYIFYLNRNVCVWNRLCNLHSPISDENVYETRINLQVWW